MKLGKSVAIAIVACVFACGSSSSPDGVKGASTLARAIVAETLADCPNGGFELEYGIDTDGNGTLSDSEVSNTYAVCHGENGGDATQGDTAFSWGDHRAAGYLTAETDPSFTASAAAGITSTIMSNWNAAYGWGDHATQGYLTSESDPVFGASEAASIMPADTSNWDTAHSWGDHATQGYLTSESDPTVNALGKVDLSSCAEGSVPKIRSGAWVCECPAGHVDKGSGCVSTAFHASAPTDIAVPDTAYACPRITNRTSGENFDFSGSYQTGTSNELGLSGCGGDPNADQGAYIVPADGGYFFQACALWDNANTVLVRNAIFLRVNNTDEIGAWNAGGAIDFFGTCVSTTYELRQGDKVYVRLYNGDNTPMDTFSQSGKYVFFSGHKVD